MNMIRLRYVFLIQMQDKFTDFLATILALQTDYPQACWFATGYEIWHSEKGKSVSRLHGSASNFKRGILGDYFGVAICSDPPVWSSATAVKRCAIQSIGGFPVGIGSGEDLLTWARLAVRYPLAYEARSLSIFRVSDTHRRADPTNKVANSLNALVMEYASVPNLCSYLGLWYRMQAVMAMRFQDHGMARRRAWLAVKYGPRQLRNVYTLLLALLPASCRQPLDAMLRRLARSN